MSENKTPQQVNQAFFEKISALPTSWDPAAMRMLVEPLMPKVPAKRFDRCRRWLDEHHVLYLLLGYAGGVAIHQLLKWVLS